MSHLEEQIRQTLLAKQRGTVLHFSSSGERGWWESGRHFLGVRIPSHQYWPKDSASFGFKREISQTIKDAIVNDSEIGSRAVIFKCDGARFKRLVGGYHGEKPPVDWTIERYDATFRDRKGVVHIETPYLGASFLRVQHWANPSLFRQMWGWLSGAYSEMDSSQLESYEFFGKRDDDGQPATRQRNAVAQTYFFTHLPEEIGRTLQLFASKIAPGRHAEYSFVRRFSPEQLRSDPNIDMNRDTVRIEKRVEGPITPDGNRSPDFYYTLSLDKGGLRGSGSIRLDVLGKGYLDALVKKLE